MGGRMELDAKLAVLSQLAKAFREQQVLWALGASGLLYCKGIVSTFHDLDIMVAEQNVAVVEDILSQLGTKTQENPNAQYKSKAFLEYVVNGVDVDVIAGFVIVNGETHHYFPLEASQITDSRTIQGEDIPLQDLACWRQYYALMGRTQKGEMIEQYLKS